MNDTTDDNRKDDDDLSSLRSTEADLRVIVGGDPIWDNQDGNTKVYWHYSQVLASQSRYVDTLLSTSLPTNNYKNPSKDHKEITFPDITPSQWERMMQYLTNSLSLVDSTVSIEDLMELVLLYDRYEFPIGIRICDKALFKMIFVWQNDDPLDVPVQYDDHINVFNSSFWATKSTLEIPYMGGGSGWTTSFHRNNSQEQEHHDRMAKSFFPLNTIQIKQLVPTIIRDGELKSQPSVANNEYLYESEEELTVDLTCIINSYFDSECPVDVTNPMFPDLLLSTMGNLCTAKCARDSVEFITVQFPSQRDHPAAGRYKLLRTSNVHDYSDVYNHLKKCPRQKQWQLHHGQRIIDACKFEYSQFSPLSPRHGWIYSELVIEYWLDKATDVFVRENFRPKIPTVCLRIWITNC